MRRKAAAVVRAGPVFLIGSAIALVVIAAFIRVPDVAGRVDGVALLLAFFGALARAAVAPPTTSKPRVRFWHFDVVFAAAAFCAIFPWLLVPGVPSFRQDWNISPDGAGYAQHLLDYASAWQPQGLGFASPQSGFYPPLIGWALAVRLIGSHYGVLAFLIVVLTLSGSFACRALRTLTGASPISCAIGALAYMAGAMTLNRLVAGHLFHIMGACILAATALASCRLRDSSGRMRIANAIFLSCIIALSMAQPQSFVLCAACALAIGFPSRTAIPVLAAVLGATVLNAPTVWSAITSTGDIYSLKHAVIAWQIAQSAPPDHLVSGGGYIARYSEALTNGKERACDVIIVLLSWYGVLKTNRLAVTVVALGLAASLLMVGLLGPLQYPLTWLFAHVSALSLFRELYDFAPLFFLGISVGLVSAIDAFCSRIYAMPQRLVALTVCCGIVFGSAAPVILGRAAELVPSYGKADIMRDIVHLKGDSRVLWVPGIYPMSLGNRASNGYDPYANTAGAHAALSPMQPIPAEALAYDLLARRPMEALTWIEKLGCGYIAFHRGVVRSPGSSSFPPESRLERGALAISTRALAEGDVEIRKLPTMPPVLSAASVVARSGLVNPGLPFDQAILLADDPANAVALSRLHIATVGFHLTRPSLLYADLRRGLMLVQNAWQEVPETALLPSTEGVAGINRTVMLGPGVLVGTWRSATVGARRLPSVDVRLKRRAPVNFVGPFALVGVRSGATHIDARVAGTPNVLLTYKQTSASEYKFDVRSGRAHALILRTRFDPGWVLSGAGSAGAVHFRADGWANGWIVDLRAGDRGVLSFVPQRWLGRIEAGSFVLWIVALLSGFWLRLTAAPTFSTDSAPGGA